MSVNVDLPVSTPASPKPKSIRTEVRLIFILAILIFVAEMIAMIVLYFNPIENYLAAMLLDGLIMVMLILPGLYFIYLKPLLNHVDERVKAEAALRAHEKLLTRVLELLPIGVWITDKSGTVIQANPAGNELWAGTRYVDIPHYGEYKAWWADSGKEVQPEEWAAARAVAYGETILNQELDIEAFDGTRRVILNSAVPILDEQNNLQGAVVINQDITTQKRTLQALEERETLFRTAMEYMPVGVWLTDGSGKITYGNPAGQAIWRGARYVGIEQFEEYKGWWLSNGKPIEPGEWAVARAINKGETSLNEEIEIECFDGSHKIILNSAIPIRDDQERILWAFIVNQDITERKEYERTLIQTNELMERYFSGISTLIAYMDREYNFLRVNDTYARSGGHPPGFFVGKNHFTLYPNRENEQIFRHVVETGEPYIVLERPFEYAEFPERGVTYWDWSLQPVKDTNGTVEGLVLSLVDVTEGKRAQMELEQKNKELVDLTNAERKQRELAESLVQSTIAVSYSLQLKEVLDAILEQIYRAVPFKAADIVLVEDKIVHVVGYLSMSNSASIDEVMNKTYNLNDFPLWLRAYSSKQTVFISDTSKTPDWQATPGMEWVNSYAAAPLLVGGEVIGIINLTSDQPGFFVEEMSAHLTALAVPAALAIQNARLYMAELDARQAAETLAAAAQALTKTLELDQVINTLLDHIKKIVYSDTAGVTLLEDETHLVTRSLRGYGSLANQEKVPAFMIDGVTDSIIHRIASTRKSITLPLQPTFSDENETSGCEPNCNWLIIPIIASDKLIGLVELGRAKDEKFLPEQIQWAEALVGQAAVAIQNAWLFQQVRTSSERLQSLARKLVEIQENERYWVARELHDEAGQALSILKLNLGRLMKDPACPDHIRLQLDKLKNTTDSVLEDLHRLAMDLRPIALDHLGLVAALEQFAKNLNSDRMSVQFKAMGLDSERLPKDLETSLYRICQEALANVIRHAQACNVGILLERDENRVMLFVEDDGIGFDPQKSETALRLGLVGMRERAEMFGGSLTIESYPGKGSSIIVEVPYVNSNPNR